MNILNKIRLFSLLLLAAGMSMPCVAQKTATVTGHYEYHVGSEDNITIRDAKQKAIELAKAEAIKNEFGVMVAADFINMESGYNDEFSSVYYHETSTSAKGKWLGDLQEPKVEMRVDPNGQDLYFIADVKGEAREIKRADTDLKWEIRKDIGGRKIGANSFDSGERFFVNFKSPADGYVAIYLISGNDETACLLPYSKDTTGRFKVKGGQEYTFFDKTLDPMAVYYKFETADDKDIEVNQIVVIYSPHPFVKCNDVSKDPHLKVLKSKDFATWLMKAQRADDEMVVNKRSVQINRTNN